MCVGNFLYLNKYNDKTHQPLPPGEVAKRKLVSFISFIKVLHGDTRGNTFFEVIEKQGGDVMVTPDITFFRWDYAVLPKQYFELTIPIGMMPNHACIRYSHDGTLIDRMTNEIGGSSKRDISLFEQFVTTIEKKILEIVFVSKEAYFKYVYELVLDPKIQITLVDLCQQVSFVDTKPPIQ